MMTGALTDDQPARVVTLGNRDGTVNRNLGGRSGQAGQGTLRRKKKTERKERMEKWLKNAYWVIFCCGLCGDWDLDADIQRHGTQNRDSGGGRRR